MTSDSGSAQLGFPIGDWIGHGVGEPAVVDKPADEAEPLLVNSRLGKLTAQVAQLQCDEALRLMRAETERAQADRRGRRTEGPEVWQSRPPSSL